MHQILALDIELGGCRRLRSDGVLAILALDAEFGYQSVVLLGVVLDDRNGLIQISRQSQPYRLWD